MSELKTHAEIIAFINELEDKFPVNEWKADDIHLWPLIRIQLAFTIYGVAHRENQIPAEQKNSSISKERKKAVRKGYTLYQHKIKRFFIYPIAGIKNWLQRYYLQKKLFSSSSILFLSFSAYRTLLTNKWYNRHIDPLLEQCMREEISAYLLEFHNGAGYKIPRFYEEYCTGMEEELSQHMHSALKKPFPGFNLTLEEYGAFFQYVKSRTGQAATKFLEKENIQDLVKRFSIYIHFFSKLLIKKKVKACFLTNYYDMKYMAACVACRQLGIPSIDLQHGAQGDFHVAYGRWNNIPEKGYFSLPSFFWCWTDQEKKTIDSWAKYSANAHRAVVSGNPWLSIWRDDEAHIVKEYDILVNKIKLPQPEAVHILYSMQPITDALPDCIIEAINNSPPDWKWWIRAHPRQDFLNYEKLLIERCNQGKFNYSEASSLPLPALLRHIQIHITNWSSVAVEAAEYNILSVLIHVNGMDLYKDLIEKNMAIQASCEASDIINTISRFINKEIVAGKQYNKEPIVLRNLLKESYGLSSSKGI